MLRRRNLIWCSLSVVFGQLQASDLFFSVPESPTPSQGALTTSGAYAPYLDDGETGEEWGSTNWYAPATPRVSDNFSDITGQEPALLFEGSPREHSAKRKRDHVSLDGNESAPKRAAVAIGGTQQRIPVDALTPDPDALFEIAPPIEDDLLVAVNPDMLPTPSASARPAEEEFPQTQEGEDIQESSTRKKRPRRLPVRSKAFVKESEESDASEPSESEDSDGSYHASGTKGDQSDDIDQSDDSEQLDESEEFVQNDSNGPFKLKISTVSKVQQTQILTLFKEGMSRPDIARTLWPDAVIGNSLAKVNRVLDQAGIKYPKKTHAKHQRASTAEKKEILKLFNEGMPRKAIGRHLWPYLKNNLSLGLVNRVLSEAGILCREEDKSLFDQISQEEKYQITEMFKKGNSLASIASQFFSHVSQQRSFSIIKKILNDGNVPTNKNIIPTQIERQIVDMYKRGISMRAIGKRIWPGTSYQTCKDRIKKVLKKADIACDRVYLSVSPAQKNKIIQMNAQGHTFRDIGKEIWPGTPYPTCQDRIRKVLRAEDEASD